MKIGEKRSVELSENVKERQLCSVSLRVEFVHAVGMGRCDGCGGSLGKKKPDSCNSVMGIYIV